MKHSRFTRQAVCSAFGLLGLAVILCTSVPGFAQGGNPGPDLFSENCAVCHGPDGKGSDRGVAIATLPNVVAMSDADLADVIHKGTSAGMPAFSQLTDRQAQAIVRYLRQLQGVTSGASASAKPTGDADAGKALYFGKAQCSSCHMINGQGGFMAADMTAYGQNRSAAAIVAAITKPDAQLAPTSRVVEIETKGGQKISGVVRAEDNMRLTVQTENGRYHFLDRSGLAKVTYADHSLMPSDYGTRLTQQELNDLASYLIVTGKAAPPQAAPRRRRGGGDD